MRTYFLFFLLSRLLGNPILAIVILVAAYALLDRRYIGLMPDVTRPWRRSSRIRQLEVGVAMRPFDADAQLELGSLLFASGRANQALIHVEAAAKKLTDHASALFTLGAIRVTIGQYTEGATALRQAVALRPEVEYGLPYVYLVRAALRSGVVKPSTQHETGLQETSVEKGELQTWIETVARFGNVEVCYRMGKELQEAGLIAEAVRLYKEAISNYRQSPPFARRAGRRWALLARFRLVTLK